MTTKRIPSKAQLDSLKKARAAAMAANNAKKQVNEPDFAVMFAEMSKRMDDMITILKDIYNRLPAPVNNDWLNKFYK